MPRVFDQQGRFVGEVTEAQARAVRVGPVGQLDPLPPCDIGKAQWIRLADVLLVGPLMVAGGLALRKQHPIAGWGLAALGVGTIGLNGYNYMRFARDQGHTL